MIEQAWMCIRCSHLKDPMLKKKNSRQLKRNRDGRDDQVSGVLFCTVLFWILRCKYLEPQATQHVVSSFSLRLSQASWVRIAILPNAHSGVLDSHSVVVVTELCLESKGALLLDLQKLHKSGGTVDMIAELLTQHHPTTSHQRVSPTPRPLPSCKSASTGDSHLRHLHAGTFHLRCAILRTIPPPKHL